jgi:hypothetical protein
MARVRILEDHLELAPPLSQDLALERQEVVAAELDPARDRSRRARSSARPSFARARLADEASVSPRVSRT